MQPPYPCDDLLFRAILLHECGTNQRDRSNGPSWDSTKALDGVITHSRTSILLCITHRITLCQSLLMADGTGFRWAKDEARTWHSKPPAAASWHVRDGGAVGCVIVAIIVLLILNRELGSCLMYMYRYFGSWNRSTIGPDSVPGCLLGAIDPSVQWLMPLHRRLLACCSCATHINQ
jgi:hypothetical protein